jgi:hypothetical protein
MKIKNQKLIELEDWDNLVSETYGRIYNFQQQDECQDRGLVYFSVPDEEGYDFTRDSIPEIVNGEEMGVSFKAWLARDPKQPLEGQKYDFELGLWWGRNFYPSLWSVANDLHEKGLLEAGDYAIEIDW